MEANDVTKSKINSAENPISTLPAEYANDMMYLDGEEALRVERMVKESYVAAHHSRAISYLENKKLWRTHIGNPRREVTRTDRSELIEYLYRYYKDQEFSSSTIEEGL